MSYLCAESRLWNLEYGNLEYEDGRSCRPSFAQPAEGMVTCDLNTDRLRILMTLHTGLSLPTVRFGAARYRGWSSPRGSPRNSINSNTIINSINVNTNTSIIIICIIIILL